MIDIEKYLSNVEKPARYTGGELNSVIKDKKNINIRYCFCFPDIYEIGMSHLGLKCIYGILNKIDDIWCERSFMPWVDMEQVLRKNNLPLFALESKDSLKDFDILGFTLQYEMSYTNVLAMLDLAGIPLKSSERNENHPLIMAGGPCTVNPEPICDFIDFFVIGEGEEVILEIVNLYREYKVNNKYSRDELLLKLSKIEGVYVPKFYEVTYNEDGTIKERTEKEGAPKTVKKRLISDLDNLYHPEDIIVPFIETVHDRVTLEIFRGCIRGCRFCQAGFIYRPVRERSYDNLIKIAERSVESTGYDEISLCSLSTSDYSDLSNLTDELLKYTLDKNINFCFPSLRIDNFDLELAKKIQSVRKSSLTFAPEAGSQRLRDIINKNIKEEDILYTAKLVFSNGWNNIKLYFMIGLPYETKEDVLGISDLAFKIQNAYFETENRIKGGRITVSTSSFIPKPFTPFMWSRQNTLEEITDKQDLLKKAMKSKFISYNWHDADLSIMEGIFARGDRKLNDVILTAYKKGCRMDSWHEHFKFDKWMEAFSENNIDYSFYNHRERSYDENLPWDFIDVGVTKKFLISENEKAKQGITTGNCREKCSGCGINKIAECRENYNGCEN